MTELPDGVERDAPIARLTTLGTGGPARFLARPSTEAGLRAVLDWVGAERLDMAVVGLGSNLLAADAGFDGVVVKLIGELAAVEREGDLLRCGGGASLAVVVRRTTDWGLGGIEFGCAIPGTVGGAVRMNAGAHGGEMRDVLVEATVVRPGGSRHEDVEGLNLSYRHSNVAADEVVAAAELRLRPDDPAAVRERVSAMQAQRKATQPAKVRTFGSVWKNPSAELSAGRLLEECGLKGYAVGGARISPVHANFIENTGGATSADVIALMAEARRRARAERGVELQHEVQMVGPIALPDD